MFFRVIATFSLFSGILILIAECRPAEKNDALGQIFPMVAVHHELPSGGRMIPVRVIHFKNIAIPSAGSGYQRVDSQEESRSKNPMVTRGFKDDFDMKSNRRSQLVSKLEMQVPIIPQNVSSPKWVRGELIVHGITRRQVKMIDQSQFGPIRSATFIPSVQAGIVIFEKRYNPEKLAKALKYLYWIESEPNGVITTSTTK
ncbi:hypothetical protein Ocin01_19928 [Orchesella cincta]|uniref:Uncharacterized protein n=1 Tax=Orchesella cincta TaxID=48709 RepID=A0A1D2M1C7_ORCCI|nr:hypothetical protein Ocin01_19928 [Orchesella cincta]